MDSVYKLSKYSQKIDEACRAKQLNKVMEYNKHELTYINKLSKYFGNQKGGATVEEVVGEVEAVLREVAEVVRGKDNEIKQVRNLFDEIKIELVQTQKKAEKHLKSLEKAQEEAQKEKNDIQTRAKILLGDFETQKTVLKGKVYEKEDELKKLQAEFAELQQLYNANNDEIEGLKSINSARNTEIAQLTERNKAIQTELAQVKQNYDNVTVELNRYKKLPTTETQSLINIQGELDRALAERDTARQELTQAQATHSNTRREFEQFQEQAQADIATTRTERDQARSELDQAQAQLTKTQAELDKVKQSLEASRKQLEEQVQRAQEQAQAQGGSKRKK
jgi:chromosome segregation ATPase